MQDRKRLTAQEQKEFVDLCAADSLLTQDPLRKRLTEEDKQQLDNCRTALESILTNVMDTMPYEQLLSYKRQMEHIRVYTSYKHAGEKETGRYLSYDEINNLLEGCWDHCLMCQKDTLEARQCPLYKVSLALPFDTICNKLEE